MIVLIVSCINDRVDYVEIKDLWSRRRDGRVAEGTTLLTWHGVKTIQGSNPCLSASNR